MMASLLLCVICIFICEGFGEGLCQFVWNDAEGLNDERRRVYI